MKKLAEQGGFVLLFTLFLLSCTMLWGSLLPVEQETAAGTLQVALHEVHPGQISIVSEGVADGNKNNVNGKVSLQASAWPTVLEWPTVQKLQEIQEPSRILINERQYELTENCLQPVAIGAIDRGPVQVEIAKPLLMERLYIDGDLFVQAPLQIKELYVSGQITGLENIDCEQYILAGEPALYYRIEVLERNI